MKELKVGDRVKIVGKETDITFGGFVIKVKSTYAIVQFDSGAPCFLYVSGKVLNYAHDDVSADYSWSLDIPESEQDCCQHEWVTTIGFTSQYTDCAKCGAKREDVA